MSPFNHLLNDTNRVVRRHQLLQIWWKKHQLVGVVVFKYYLFLMYWSQLKIVML